MVVEIDINNIGLLITYISKNNFSKYIQFKEIKSYLLRESRNINKVNIQDGNIYIKTNDFKLTINNYKNNKESALGLIIERAIKEKQKERRDYLRNKKIKRIKTIAGTLVISVGLITAGSIIEEKEIIDKPNNIETTKSINENELEVENEISKIINEYSDNKEKAIEENNVVEQSISNSINEKEKEIIEFNINYDTRINSEKFRITKAYYNDMITSISKEYGIDPQIMLAIATQESGIHRIDKNGPAIGLMQIELSVWNNKTIKAYNFKNNTYETYKITEEKLKDLEFNIRVACMHFQNCLENSNYNIPIAIQMYNYGYGNMEKVFKLYYNLSNIDLKQIINNDDNNWIDYRNIINEGDNEYLEHILSYIENINELECRKISSENKVSTFKINKDVKML